MRPTTLDEVIGQEKWIGPGCMLRTAIDQQRVESLLLWGPPGCGKTTIARCIAEASNLRYRKLSAVLDGIKQLREVIDTAKTMHRMEGRATCLFVDEIHRWNKAQQDALLPHVETGLIVLIGATTENPSFEVNPALRSRVRLVRLEPLTSEQILALLQRACGTAAGVADRSLVFEPEGLRLLADAAGGDARRALSDLERCVNALSDGATLTCETVVGALQREDIRHDKGGEDHYNVLSALIKSMRGSDPQASLYWLARLIAGGEPLPSIARRLIIFASEDVGNADPRALSVAIDAATAVNWVGRPEGRIPLAQAVTWLATCPKSNAAYKGIDQALEDVKRFGALPVPLHLRNAATAQMKEDGYGVNYQYPHDHPHHIVKQRYLPDRVQDARYYTPTSHGVEKTIAERMSWWAKKISER
jgi:putative ATPase